MVTYPITDSWRPGRLYGGRRLLRDVRKPTGVEVGLDDLPEFLTVEEAAAVLRISRTSAYQPHLGVPADPTLAAHARPERPAGAAAGTAVAGAALGDRTDGRLAGRRGVTARPEGPIDRWASTDVLAAVVDVAIAALLRRAPSKDEALLALAARRELEDRMRRHRWLALETARQAGATGDRRRGRHGADG